MIPNNRISFMSTLAILPDIKQQHNFTATLRGCTIKKIAWFRACQREQLIKMSLFLFFKLLNLRSLPSLPLTSQHATRAFREITHVGEESASCFSNDLLYHSCIVSQSKCAHLQNTAQTSRLHMTNSPLLFATEQLYHSRWEMSVWGKREHYSFISSAHIFTARHEIWTIHLTMTSFCHFILLDAPSIVFYTHVY